MWGRFKRASVNVRGKHLKQINIPQHLLMVQVSLVADEEWQEYEKKKDWVEEADEKEMAAVLIVQVE